MYLITDNTTLIDSLQQIDNIDSISDVANTHC